MSPNTISRQIFSGNHSNDLEENLHIFLEKILFYKATSSHDPLFYLTRANENLHSFFLTPITSAEIRGIIEDFRNKSSSATDGLIIKMFTNLSDCALNHISNLMNKCFLNGTFPTCLQSFLCIQEEIKIKVQSISTSYLR